jgi:hypothetical protein
MRTNDTPPTSLGQAPSPADQFSQLIPLARMLVALGLVADLDLKKFDEVAEQIKPARPADKSARKE